MYQKKELTVNITLNDERLNVFQLKIRNKLRMFIFTTVLQYKTIEDSAPGNKAKNEIKGILTGKE